MFKLNRTTEYGLIALRHISRKNASDPMGVSSAREISDFYGLPFEIMAKTLQKLKECGLIESAHGARGGYTLQRSLSDISLAEFLGVMEGPQAVVACSSEHAANSHDGCEYTAKCEIKGVMTQLNHRIHSFLSQIPLAELAGVGVGVGASASAGRLDDLARSGVNLELIKKGVLS